MPENNDTLLSQSLVENQNAASMRDPFIKAQQQFQERQMGKADVLGSSPMNPPSDAPVEVSIGSPETTLLGNPSNSQDFTDFNSSPIPQALQKLGIDNKGISMNQLGRVQMLGRFKQKFGESYSDSPDVMNVLKLFDTHLNKLKNTDASKSAISNGQRTLAALLGG